eukprot:Seg5594.2 transcript_id=Seg5594.2/GoldUCD/mRNA.D3Y31 product="hypothetical protein" protein_id=Seg5594.2/GoldUCD/D3Y31
MECPIDEARKQENQQNVTESISADNDVQFAVTSLSDSEANSSGHAHAQDALSSNDFPRRDQDSEPMEYSVVSSGEERQVGQERDRNQRAEEKEAPSQIWEQIDRGIWGPHHKRLHYYPMFSRRLSKSGTLWTSAIKS